MTWRGRWPRTRPTARSVAPPRPLWLCSGPQPARRTDDPHPPPVHRRGTWTVPRAAGVLPDPVALPRPGPAGHSPGRRPMSDTPRTYDQGDPAPPAAVIGLQD